MADRFDDVLNECTERLLKGESVEQCLARYPEEATELEPLLRIALAAGKASSAVKPRPEFKARTRYEVQLQFRSKERKVERRRTSALRWVPRWAVVAACVTLVLVLAGGSTVAASTDAIPGDTLYAVKTAAEQIQLKLTFSDAAKARLEAKFAERRVWEAARLAEKGRTAKLWTLAARFEAHLARIEQLAAQIEATDPGDSGQVTELREILYTNMAGDLELLDAAEAGAPGQARMSIAAARFTLMQEYEKAIEALDEVQDRQAMQAGSSGDAESGETDGSGLDGEMGSDGSTGSAQRGQMTPTGFQVQAHYAGTP